MKEEEEATESVVEEREGEVRAAFKCEAGEVSGVVSSIGEMVRDMLM